MKKIGLSVALVLVGYYSTAQKYTAESSTITFFSDAAIEDIKATNTKSSSIFNSATGDIVFSIPIKDFEFAKSLMKEHFNEKYMETEKFPKATFQGKITGFQATATGEQQATAAGKLSIHGETNEINVPGTIVIQDGKLKMKSKFMVKLNDYKITIPQIVWQNIAEEVEVSIEFTYKSL